MKIPKTFLSKRAKVEFEAQKIERQNYNEQVENIGWSTFEKLLILIDKTLSYDVVQDRYWMAWNKYSSTDSFRKLYKELNYEMDRSIPSIYFSNFLNFLQNDDEFRSTIMTVINSQMGKTMDLRNPYTWFELSRKEPRNITCHVGPTNSGKTFKAIELLKASKKAIYCAPLRLLATEIYQKLNNEGYPCLLMTGEVIRDSQGNLITREKCEELMETVPLLSCTVEMFQRGKRYDLAVIDEIQLMADPQRGSSFTEALLGLDADEVHLCGETGIVGLIEDICFQRKEAVNVIKYERMSQLLLQSTSFNEDCVRVTEKAVVNLYDQGDCIISFSRSKVFDIKNAIEKRSKLRCAVVYGNMPPEVRLNQAKLFNERKEYDVIIATGNRSINRVIFYDIIRMNEVLAPQTIRQIAGRAGRGNQTGLVTTFYNKDFEIVANAINGEPTQYTRAGLFPTYEHLKALHKQQPDLSLPNVFKYFSDCAYFSDKFFYCASSSLEKIAQTVDQYENISFHDKIMLCGTPVRVNEIFCLELFKLYMKAFSAKKRCGVLMDMKELCKMPDAEPYVYETLHNANLMYSWLSVHFPSQFHEGEKAQENCKRIVEKLNEVLLKYKDMNRHGKIQNFKALKQLKSVMKKEKIDDALENYFSTIRARYELENVENVAYKLKEDNENKENINENETALALDQAEKCETAIEGSDEGPESLIDMITNDLMIEGRNARQKYHFLKKRKDNAAQ